MINEVLTNLTYLFYPRGICPWNESEKYLQSEEYKRLQSTIDFFYSDESQKIRNVIKKDFELDLTFKDFEDHSRRESQDRCFTFFINVIEDGELHSITLYLSFLSPYYVIRHLEHKNNPFFSKSRIEELESEKKDSRKIKDLILDLETIVENKLSYTKFPQEMMCTIIKDVSFQDTYLGYFKMFNAFFNNTYINQDND